MGTALGLVGGLAILIATRGEKLPEMTFAALDDARSRWDAFGPKNYDLDLELFGPTSGTAHLEIRGDDVSMTLSGRAVDKRIADYNSIVEQFSIIRRDLEACAEAAKKGDRSGTAPIFSRGVFDEKLGFPAAYRRVTPNGTEAGWRVVKFVPRQ